MGKSETEGGGRMGEESGHWGLDGLCLVFHYCKSFVAQNQGWERESQRRLREGKYIYIYIYTHKYTYNLIWTSSTMCNITESLGNARDGARTPMH